MQRLDRLTLAQARRIALAAQGFGERRPRTPGRRHLERMLARLGLVQIDSVNVLVRAHYMPAFSRLGAYDPALLDRAAYGGKRRTLFEYWGHEASLLSGSTSTRCCAGAWPAPKRGEGIYDGLARFGEERRGLRPGGAARGRGAGADRRRANWPTADEAAAAGGAGATASARSNGCSGPASSRPPPRRGFERVYDLPERVLPAAVLAAPTPPEPEAQRELVRIAARTLGVATERDLRDYFRLGVADAKARIAELVEEGAVMPVEVEGWPMPAYLDPTARRPRRIEARALISPFDPLVWERSRAERLFGFRYRIEIYTPAHKREHGYYVLPFLLGDKLVARVDLKADRAGGRLLVHAVHVEPFAEPDVVGPALRDELQAMAAWLSQGEVVPGPKARSVPMWNS